MTNGTSLSWSVDFGNNAVLMNNISSASFNDLTLNANSGNVKIQTSGTNRVLFTSVAMDVGTDLGLRIGSQNFAYNQVYTVGISSGGARNLTLGTSGTTNTQFEIVHQASATCYWQAQGATTGNIARLLVAGSQADESGGLSSKGIGSIYIYSNSFANPGLKVTGVASSANFIILTPAIAGSDCTISVSAANLIISPQTQFGSAISVNGTLTANNSVFISGNLQVAGGATTLLKTTSAWNNGAAAAAGTLTNAPVAGNPTKWLAFDDNGTIRYVPAW